MIPLLNVNVVLNGPGLESHPNSMLIAFWDEKCKKTRHIFVYAEVGKVYYIHVCVTEKDIQCTCIVWGKYEVCVYASVCHYLLII